MSPPEAVTQGVLADPHTAHVVASYAVTAIGMAGLALWAWAASRRWAKRQKAAAAREAALKGGGHG
jgi:heme exporter protein CcmD